MVIKKTIILSNKTGNYKDCIALLCLQRDHNETLVRLKLYSLPKGKYIFGLCEDKNILLKQEFYVDGEQKWIISKDFNLDGKVSAVIVDDKLNLALWGNYNFKDIIFEEDMPLVSKIVSNKTDLKPQIERLDRASEQFNNYMQEVKGATEPTPIVTQTNIEAKESLFEAKPEEIEKQIDDELNTTFFDEIKDQIMELFDKYPSQESLQKLIPHSKWINVKYDDDASEYVLGLVYAGDGLKYIAYGVPGTEDMELSPEIRDYSVFVPTMVDGGIQKGFYVMYQDAISGQEINLAKPKDA